MSRDETAGEIEPPTASEEATAVVTPIAKPNGRRRFVSTSVAVVYIVGTLALRLAPAEIGNGAAMFQVFALAAVVVYLVLLLRQPLGLYDPNGGLEDPLGPVRKVTERIGSFGIALGLLLVYSGAVAVLGLANQGSSRGNVRGLIYASAYLIGVGVFATRYILLWRIATATWQPARVLTARVKRTSGRVRVHLELSGSGTAPAQRLAKADALRSDVTVGEVLPARLLCGVDGLGRSFECAALAGCVARVRPGPSPSPPRPG